MIILYFGKFGLIYIDRSNRSVQLKWNNKKITFELYPLYGGLAKHKIVDGFGKVRHDKNNEFEYFNFRIHVFTYLL